VTRVFDYGSDIYTEAEGSDDTLANLGPLRALAGVWESGADAGLDEHPVVEGTLAEGFVERYELQPIDRQTNGPQLFYGLRYHTHIVKPGEVETFHDQVGYWLWEPAAHAVTLTLAIPRGQVLLARGAADADSTEFEVTSEVDSPTVGIISNPFLDQSFRTVRFRMHVVANADGTWSYDEETVLKIPGRDEEYLHTDANTLRKVAEPTPNPLALGAR
jgi:hypothetical protein